MPRRRRPQDKVDHLLDELLADYSTPEQILGEQGLLKQLTKRLVERALQAELSHHLETEVQAPPPEETSSSKRRNSRNGYSSKTVKADCGELALSIPRDRNSTFEPILVPKGERRLSGLDDKIMAMYARGLSTRDIQAQLEELYGVEVSPTLISQVTDAVSDEVRQWQNRPLAKLYPIVYLDAIHVHVEKTGG
ncbi:Transposase, Mutator family [Leptolyngbya sp. O-77]|nr:Transposase, Mutator family [Leptolyngbya sp. O-77]